MMLSLHRFVCFRVNVLCEGLMCVPHRPVGTINRSHSTPCKKAEFEHLHFCRTLLGLFCACERQDLSFTFQTSENTTYLDNLVFSASSILWGTVKKFRLKSNRRHTLPGIGVLGSLWQIVHTKMHFFCIGLTNIDQCWITCSFKAE